MAQCPSEDLEKILAEHDTEEWSEDAFAAIKDILSSRASGVESEPIEEPEIEEELAIGIPQKQGNPRVVWVWVLLVAALICSVITYQKGVEVSKAQQIGVRSGSRFGSIKANEENIRLMEKLMGPEAVATYRANLRAKKASRNIYGLLAFGSLTGIFFLLVGPVLRKI